MKRVPKKGTNVPKTEKWRPVEGKPWLEQNEKGQLRTNIKENELANWPGQWKAIFTVIDGELIEL